MKFKVTIELEGNSFEIPKAEIYLDSNGTPYLFGCDYYTLMAVLHDNGYYTDHRVNSGLDILKRTSKPSHREKVSEIWSISSDCEQVCFKGRLEILEV